MLAAYFVWLSSRRRTEDQCKWENDMDTGQNKGQCRIDEFIIWMPLFKPIKENKILPQLLSTFYNIYSFVIFFMIFHFFYSFPSSWWIATVLILGPIYLPSHMFLSLKEACPRKLLLALPSEGAAWLNANIFLPSPIPDPHLHSYPDHNPSNHTLTILMLAISESGPFPPSSSSKPHPHPYLFAHLQWAWPFPQWIGRAQLSIPSRPRRSGHGRKPAENDDKAHSKTKLHFGEIILREDKTVIIVHMYATNFGTVQWGEWYQYSGF